MTLRVLRNTGLVYYRMASTGICLMFFSCITHCQCFMTVDIDFGHLAEAMFIRFLHCKIILPLPFHAVLSGRRSLCAAHTLNNGKLCAPREFLKANLTFNLTLSMCYYPSTGISEQLREVHCRPMPGMRIVWGKLRRRG